MTMAPARALHPSQYGRPHQLSVDTTPAWPGRARLVATCSCLSWSGSLLARDGVTQLAAAQLREDHGDHVAANSPALPDDDDVPAEPTSWWPR